MSVGSQQGKDDQEQLISRVTHTHTLSTVAWPTSPSSKLRVIYLRCVDVSLLLLLCVERRRLSQPNAASVVGERSARLARQVHVQVQRQRTRRMEDESMCEQSLLSAPLPVLLEVCSMSPTVLSSLVDAPSPTCSTDHSPLAATRRDPHCDRAAT